MQVKDVRPEILDAFNSYAFIMTEQQFIEKYSPTLNELCALKSMGDFSEGEEIVSKVDIPKEHEEEPPLTDEQWWRLYNEYM